MKPDLIITQGLCDVCAVSENEVTEICEVLENSPEILSLNPTTIGEILDSIVLLGEVTQTKEKASQLVDDLRKRIETVEKKLSGERYRPGVFCLEWLDPPYAAGHWVPEMVKTAGGEPLISRTGEPSFKTSWDEILESSPDYLIIMPCGFDVEKTLDGIEELTGGVRQWHTLRAVQKGHCYIVDANSYFSRSSPRVVDGIELLAGIIHSDIFTQRPRKDSVLNVKNISTCKLFSVRTEPEKDPHLPKHHRNLKEPPHSPALPGTEKDPHRFGAPAVQAERAVRYLQALPQTEKDLHFLFAFDIKNTPMY